MPAENDDKMTNSDENDAQNEQNSMCFDANCTHKEVTDILTHSIKPSEPSANNGDSISLVPAIFP
jgi:hypothetical protein